MNTMPDLDLDDIEDLPGFDTPPSGEYICSLTLTRKELKGKDYVSFDFKLIEVKQIGTQEIENPAVVGQKFGVLFGYTEQGLGFMKPYLKQFKTALGTSGNISEIIEATKDLNVDVVFKYKASKGTGENEGKDYLNLNIAKLTVI